MGGLAGRGCLPASHPGRITGCRGLGADYVDLYLIHSPVPGKRLDSWRALEFLQATGRTRSIGVSNYGIHHLEELRRVAQVMPAVNQIEAHPFLVRDALIVYCEENDIAIEAYSPLAKARRLDDPDLVAIGAKCVCVRMTGCARAVR